MRLKKFLTVLILSVLSIVALSQHKLTIKADQAFEKGYWSSAIENYRLALKKEKNAEIKLRIIYNLAQSYTGAKDYKNSVTWLKKVKNKGKAFLKDHPDILLKLADSYKALERYTDAMATYNEYSEIMPDDEKGERGSKSCELAIKWTQNPTRYKIKNERLINSKFDDAIPVYSNKRYKEIVYQSYRSGAEGKGTNDVNGQAYPDLYSSKLQKDGKWTSPTPLQGDKENGVNTSFAEGGPAMNSKMNEIYFTRCKNYEGKSKKEKSCQIYSSKKRGAAYSDAVILEIGNDSVMNSRSMLSASNKISLIRAGGTLFTKWLLCRCTAKSQCTPSSLEINSLEKVRPGIRPRFFNQKIEQNAPEKKIPSTAANAIKRSAKEGLSIHFNAQSAFFLIAGKFSIALNSISFSFSSFT